MKLILKKSAVFFVALSILACYPRSVRSERPSTERMLFAVWAAQRGKKTDTPIFDPIVILDGTEFKKIGVFEHEKEEESAAAYERFVKDYYRPGQKYQTFFGGGHLGELAIVKEEEISCVSLVASVKLSAIVPNGQYALAAGSAQGFKLHPNWRRAPSSAQQSSFLDLVSKVLDEHKVSSVSSTAIRIKNLRVTNLRESGPDVLIGSITYKQSPAVHNLFLVAEQKDEKWEVAISSYQVAESGEDATDNVVENFVDQLDLDSDGTDEIVSISGYYESWDYAIYKEKNGKWEKVYRGGGGGC